MRVACCGLTTLDVVQYVNALPGPDQKVQADDALVEFGGPAANAAFTAVALGAEATLISAVGQGPVGRVVAAQLRDAGIDLLDAGPAEWDAPVSAVTVVGSSRSVVSPNAGSAPPTHLPLSALDGVSALLVDGHHLLLCIAAAGVAQARGIPVLLDGGSWKPGLENLITLVDAAVLSADFRADVDWGQRPVAVSDGPHPIRLGDRLIPVPQVPITDTVGAGDVLHGALLGYIARHGLEHFAEGLEYAAGIASESCRHAGAHSWCRM